MCSRTGGGFSRTKAPPEETPATSHLLASLRREAKQRSDAGDDDGCERAAVVNHRQSPGVRAASKLHQHNLEWTEELLPQFSSWTRTRFISVEEANLLTPPAGVRRWLIRCFKKGLVGYLNTRVFTLQYKHRFLCYGFIHSSARFNSSSNNNRYR